MEAVIVAYNSGYALLACAGQLLHDPAIGCVHVIDNSPGAADAHLLRSAFVGCARLDITVNAQNYGFGSAINFVLRSVDDDLVAIVNPDGLLDAGAIKRVMQELEAEPTIVLAGARLLDSVGREQQGSRRREPTPRRLIANTLVRALRLRRWYRFGFEMSDAPLPSVPVVVDAVSGACMVARTAALRAVGGFDERFFLHFEDLDLCKRLRDAGGRIVFVPDAVFRHEGGGSSRSRPYFVIWHKHLSMVKYYWKHYRRLRAGGLWLPLVILTAAARCLLLMGRQALRRNR